MFLQRKENKLIFPVVVPIFLPCCLPFCLFRNAVDSPPLNLTLTVRRRVRNFSLFLYLFARRQPQKKMEINYCWFLSCVSKSRLLIQERGKESSSSSSSSSSTSTFLQAESFDCRRLVLFFTMIKCNFTYLEIKYCL